MARLRLSTLFVVLAVSLLWTLPAAAAGAPDPNACLPTCYAYYQAPTNGTGIKGSPWQVTNATLPALLNSMQNAVDATTVAGPYTLDAVSCPGGKPPCTGRRYEFTPGASGPTVATLENPGVPMVGVDVPAPYLVAGGLLAAALLIGIGLATGRRARRVAA